MRIYCFHPEGFEGQLVEIEVDIRRGLPSLDLVGLAGPAVREARDRVRVAIQNAGFEFPNARILVNLSPAGVAKRGTAYDLALAVAILAASDQLVFPPPIAAGGLLCMGELALSGMVRPVTAALPGAVAARHAGLAAVLVAAANLGEVRDARPAAFAALESLSGLSGLGRSEQAWTSNDHLEFPTPVAPNDFDPDPEASQAYETLDGVDDWKLALAVAATGRHHLLVYGPPGRGKSLGVQALRALLPRLGPEAAETVSRIYSIAGQLPSGWSRMAYAPLRWPHHSASAESILGGGPDLRPGEVSLAHGGVLVLDEALEFRSNVLQGLREPLESGSIQVCRARGSVAYPAGGFLALTMNPCPCGNLGRSGARCLCPAVEVNRYWGRLGAPLWDRIDIRFGLFDSSDDLVQLLGFDLGLESIRQRILRARTRLAESGPAPFSAKAAEWFQNRPPTESRRSQASLGRLAQTIAAMAGTSLVEPLHCLVASRLREIPRQVAGLPLPF